MISEGLKIEVSADVKSAEDGIKILQRQLERLGRISEQAGLSFKQLDRINGMISKTASEIRKFENASTTLNKLQGSSMRATQTLTDLSRVAQDMPYGFMAISNNINPLFESFHRLQKETGSTAAAFKSMAGSLIGPAGVGLAIGVVSSLFVKYGDTIFDVFTSLSDAEKAQRRVNEAISEASAEFTKAYTSVMTLTNEIDLAKQGFLDKDRVVDHYNETIGRTTGKVHSLKEAEKELAENAEAYIKMTLAKAAANIALEKAANAAFRAAQEKRSPLKNYSVKEEVPFNPEVYAFGADSVKAYTKKRDAEIAQLNKQRQDGRVRKIKEEEEDYRKIAEDFYKEMADISSKFHFDPFGGDYKKKTPASKDFAFLDGFLNFDPNKVQEGTKKFAEVVEKTLDFVFKNRENYDGLDNILKLFGVDPKQAVKAANEWNDRFQKGLIDYRSNLKVSTDFSMVPPIQGEVDAKKYYDMFLKSLEQEQSKQESKEGIPITMNPDFLQENKEIEKYEEIGGRIGRKVGVGFDKVFSKQFSKSALKAIDSGLKGKQLEDYMTREAAAAEIAVQGINAMNSGLTAFNDKLLEGGDAFAAFGAALNQSIKEIIKSLLMAIEKAALLSLLSGGAANGGVSFFQAFGNILSGGNTARAINPGFGSRSIAGGTRTIAIPYILRGDVSGDKLNFVLTTANHKADKFF